VRMTIPCARATGIRDERYSRTDFAPKGGGRLPLPERCSLDLSCFEEPEVQDALAVAIEEILYVVTFSGIELQALDGVTVTSDCRAAACACKTFPKARFR